ncbi:hypothetical protein CP532_1107 [Ophiocordyceps camponoti-leonardi (nom. inval.)]|nr:hypothetical protein CP532_1107 [Ophiocordyceps camponoti-leonardi (nom. inval.)]
MPTRKRSDLGRDALERDPDSSKTQKPPSVEPGQTSSSKGNEGHARPELGQGQASANGSEDAQQTNKRVLSPVLPPARVVKKNRKIVKLKVGPPIKPTSGDTFVKQASSGPPQPISEEDASPAPGQTSRPAPQTPPPVAEPATQASAQVSQPAVQTPPTLQPQTQTRQPISSQGSLPTMQPQPQVIQPSQQVIQPTRQMVQIAQQQHMLQQHLQQQMRQRLEVQQMMQRLQQREMVQQLQSTNPAYRPMTQTLLPVTNEAHHPAAPAASSTAVAVPAQPTWPAASPAAASSNISFAAQSPNSSQAAFSNASSATLAAHPTQTATQHQPTPTSGAGVNDATSIEPRPTREQQRRTLMQLRATQLLVESGLAVSHSSITLAELNRAERFVFNFWMRIGQSSALPPTIIDKLGRTELAGYNAGRSVIAFGHVQDPANP